MFGLALRGYQKRVQRLSESASVRDRTLWEATYDFVCDEERVSRKRIGERFAKDSAEHVAAVLNDLVSSGLIFATGRGRNAFYRVVSASDRREAAEDDSVESLASLVWQAVYRRRARSLTELRAALNAPENALREAVDQLVADKRLTRSGAEPDAELHAATLLIPVGAERGWEAAVFDHFRAVATAIANKVQRGPRSQSDDVVGGATLSFDVYAEHPHRAEVYGLLAKVRGEVNELWNRVAAFNKANPVAEDAKTKVSFYFGQNVERSDSDQESQESPT
jgi:DNA-binding Lrp family transcriptional regulator